MSPQVKNTIIIAGVATLTVVGVLLVTRAVIGPRSMVAAPNGRVSKGIMSVTGSRRGRA